MARGIHSTINLLNLSLQGRWGIKWYESFQDHTLGGFYERLGHSFKPIYCGQRRLLTQCRQLSVYSALRYNGLQTHFNHIIQKYYNQKTGLWIFSLNDQGDILDSTCDLYALTFVIFMCAQYYQATHDEAAHTTALQTLNTIKTRFKMPNGIGYAESLNNDGIVITAIRRQNPHMHLLEACLFAYETWNDDAFIKIADEMIHLFNTYFFNAEKTILHEYFDDELKPHTEKGNWVEPGHYFEWVWLLKKHAELKKLPDLHIHQTNSLFLWAHQNGWDPVHGGVYDVLEPDGNIKTDTKRIWPFCEALKAYALMLAETPHETTHHMTRQRIKERVTDMVHVFENKYIQERGFWTEILNRDLSNQTDYMPGTTPYHVFFGIQETKKYLDRRGPSKSIIFNILALIFMIERALSKAFKFIKTLNIRPQ